MTANIIIMNQSAGLLHSRPKRNKSDNLFRQRKELVENYIKSAGVTDKRVLKAFLKTPRHEFVPIKYRIAAYLDVPLPIGEGQTITQPSLVAIMTQALELKGNEKVLEIGTGSGFQAAILSKLAKDVYTVEIIGKLAKKARKTLERLAIKNVHLEVANGSLGLENYAPYDAIIVTAAANMIPKPLIKQLKCGGRIVIPVGDTLYGQELKVGKKVGKTIKFINIEPVMFVPLHGKFGFQEKFDKLYGGQKFGTLSL